MMFAITMAAALSASCEHYNATAAYLWMKKQGCTDGVPSSCPGNITPAAGCTDAVWIARTLAAAGVIPLDPDSPKRSDYNPFVAGGVSYNLELSSDLQAYLKTQGWGPNSSATVDDTEFGALLLTNAFVAMPCFALGSGYYTCHEPPLLYGPQCAVGADMFRTIAPQPWGCMGAPPVPTPPLPTPAPTPAPCNPAVCYPNSEAYVCRPKPGLSQGDLQSLIDYCCSSGTGVNCVTINEGGACYKTLTNLTEKVDWCLRSYYQIQCPQCIVPVHERCDFAGKGELVKGPIPCPSS